jgi:hypothetical protein
VQCQKEFTNDIESISATVRGLAADSLYIHSDLCQLFRMAAAEAKKSRSQSRTLRVVIIMPPPLSVFHIIFSCFQTNKKMCVSVYFIRAEMADKST